MKMFSSGSEAAGLGFELVTAFPFPFKSWVVSVAAAGSGSGVALVGVLPAAAAAKAACFRVRAPDMAFVCVLWLWP